MFTHKNLDLKVPTLTQVTGANERHYVTEQGKKYPSVTTVLSEYGREAIQEWRVRVGAEEANKITRRASTRGTKIHKYCEEYLDNKELVFTNPLHIQTFNDFKPLLNRIDNIYAQELRMYSDHLRMAGTVDCVAELDGKLTIIDFKTAAKPKDKEKIENYFMQCSAYAIMFEELFKIPVNRIAILIAVDDHEPQLFIEKRDKYVEKLIYYRDLYESRLPIGDGTDKN
jgi:genome maintenance exonuclease 1